MSIEQEKMIVESLPSLYPLQEFEEKAIDTVLDAIPHWIPVTERLPEEDKDVLCKTLAGVIFVASYGKLHRQIDEKGWIITPSLERAGISFVDWWMPLPEFKKGGWKND